ncbi:MAG: hypothetical protein ACYC75_00560 [Minisyncoccota bacterium]
MSLLALKKEISHIQVWAHAYASPALCQAWLAPGVLLISFPAFSAVITAQPFAPSHASGINMEVAYEPIARLGEPTTLSLSPMSMFGNKGEFSIRVGKALSDNFSISQINPQPLSTRTDLDGVLYLFSAADMNTLTLTLVPKFVGETAATLQYDLDPPIAFSINTRPR